MIFQTYKNYQSGREVEAVKLTADNADELEELLPRGYKVEEIDPFDSSKRTVGLNFQDYKGHMQRASEGDYILHEFLGKAEGYAARPPLGFEMNWEMT